MKSLNDKSIFQNTIAENSARAILKMQSTKLTEEINQIDSLINFQESIHGLSLVHYSVRHDKCTMLEYLSEAGLNFDIVDNYGETALFEAVYFSKNSCVKSLLEFGANPNINYEFKSNDLTSNAIELGTSPLMVAAGRDLEVLKYLIEYGANVNYSTSSGRTAAIIALSMRKVEIAHELIVNSNAKIDLPYNLNFLVDDSIQLKQAAVKDRYPVDLLTKWVFPLNSREHQLKMAIVEKFENQGINYWSREIPESTLNQIKSLYPDSWEEYVKNY